MLPGSHSVTASPVFGPFDEKVGATWMKVTIGPQQDAIENYGRPPQANTPTIMRALLDGEFNSHHWVAGHPLNDNLGGLGKAQNLTLLPAAGNHNHLINCEATSKDFIHEAYSRIETAKKEDEYWFGVHYEVYKGNEPWLADHPVLKHVATHLRITAYVVKQYKMTLEISRAERSECPSPMKNWFAPLEDVRVDNTGYNSLFLY